MNAEAGKCCGCEQLQREFRHLRSSWWWLFLFGILLAVCGAAAVIFPALTVLTTVVAMRILGIVLIVAGIATIVMSFWAGKWSGLLVQLLDRNSLPGRGLHDYRQAAAVGRDADRVRGRVLHRGGRLPHPCRNAGPVPALGLVALERHRHVPAGSDHLSSLPRVLRCGSSACWSAWKCCSTAGPGSCSRWRSAIYRMSRSRQPERPSEFCRVRACTHTKHFDDFEDHRVRASTHPTEWHGPYGRMTVVPLSRRINRRISKTLMVESTCETGRPVSETIWSIGVASPPIAESTCCSNSFKSSSAG